MSACSKCVLRCGASRVVAGAGNPDAKIMFIGEAPGKKEDELGIPFVGSAGKFLDEMLSTIKLNRSDIYIANVCKCRPPGNRDPRPEEIDECWPWLEKQIIIIDAAVIVTLGKHSLNRFVPNAKISESHGKLFEINLPQIGMRKIFALYHPAAALYNGSMRKILIEDFKKIPKILNNKIKKEQ